MDVRIATRAEFEEAVRRLATEVGEAVWKHAKEVQYGQCEPSTAGPYYVWESTVA